MLVAAQPRQRQAYALRDGQPSAAAETRAAPRCCPMPAQPRQRQAYALRDGQLRQQGKRVSPTEHRGASTPVRAQSLRSRRHRTWETEAVRVRRQAHGAHASVRSAAAAAHRSGADAEPREAVHTGGIASDSARGGIAARTGRHPRALFTASAASSPTSRPFAEQGFLSLGKRDCASSNLRRPSRTRTRDRVTKAASPRCRP